MAIFVIFLPKVAHVCKKTTNISFENKVKLKKKISAIIIFQYVHNIQVGFPSIGSAKGPLKTLAMTQLDSIAKSMEKKSGKLPPTKVDLCSKIIFLYSLVEEPVILDGDLPFLFTRHAKRIG